MDDRSFVAAQNFLLSSKTFWTKRIYRELKQTYDDAVDQSGQESATPLPAMQACTAMPNGPSMAAIS